MDILSLNGTWKLCIPGSPFGEITAKVPGSVYGDLLSAGKIPDPFWRDNENEALKIMEYDFVYDRTFSVDAKLLAHERIWLRCHGLDTLATVEVNGHPPDHPGLADPVHPGGLCPAAAGRLFRRDAGVPLSPESTLHVRLGLGPPASRRGDLAGH